MPKIISIKPELSNPVIQRLIKQDKARAEKAIKAHKLKTKN